MPTGTSCGLAPGSKTANKIGEPTRCRARVTIDVRPATEMLSPRSEPPADAPEGTTWLGGPMPWCSITLRIMGDTLDPNAITKVLKRMPTTSYRKGDDMRRPDGASLRPARSGRWSLRFTPDALPFDDGCDAIEHMLTLFPGDIEAWRAITTRHRADFQGAGTRRHLPPVVPGSTPRFQVR